MTTPRITSRQNPRVQDAVRLRTGRGRRRQGRHIIDGVREIRRAVEAGIPPVEAFVCDALQDPTRTPPVLELLRRAGAELLPVTTEVYAKICFGERDEIGVVVVAETPQRRLSELQLPPAPLVAVVEGVEKPGNLGAILRSADAAGIDAVIVADGATDLFNPNTIRASLGTVFGANVVEATTSETIDWLKQRGLRAPGSLATAMRIVVARPEAELSYTSIDFRGGVAIVLGCEATGLSDAWHGADAWRGAEVESVRLPMCGIADSLNVSTTAAVLFYEALRQRGETNKSQRA